MSASPIGCLGQAHFPFLCSLRSFIQVTLLFAVWFGVRRAPLHACVGLEVESPSFRGALICAADIFGFIHEPRPDWTIPSGWVVGYLAHVVLPTWSWRNSVPSIHMRCRRTASLRAAATTARRRPLVRIRRMPKSWSAIPPLLAWVVHSLPHVECAYISVSGLWDATCHSANEKEFKLAPL